MTSSRPRVCRALPIGSRFLKSRASALAAPSVPIDVNPAKTIVFTFRAVPKGFLITHTSPQSRPPLIVLVLYTRVGHQSTSVTNSVPLRLQMPSPDPLLRLGDQGSTVAQFLKFWSPFLNTKRAGTLDRLSASGTNGSAPKCRLNTTSVAGLYRGEPITTQLFF